MQTKNKKIISSATDLATFLTCHHATKLDYQVAKGLRKKPNWDNSLMDALAARGEAHEVAYLDRLDKLGKRGIRFRDKPSIAKTIKAMKAGYDYVAQARFADGTWHGYPDVLIKVEGRSKFGSWSYEVVDTKLARETKGETLLQVSLYSTMLHDLLGSKPVDAHVVTPGTDYLPETYRLDSFGAYYRLVKEDYLAFIKDGDLQVTYPEPVTRCDRCRWEPTCTRQ